jgi:hypothetical protein
VIRPRPSKNIGQKGFAATYERSASLSAAAGEPEIDIEAAIQDYINESMAKLSEAIQNWTAQLLRPLRA